MAINGVVLDIDGTLLDSNDAHTLAWLQVCREQHVHVPFGEVRCMIGMGGDKIVKQLFGVEKASPKGREISERRLQIFKEQFLAQVQPFPGVRELLQKMKSAGLKVAIGTSSSRSELEEFMKILGVGDVVDVSGSDAEASKPDPDIVAAAVEKLQLPPDECVMIGDTPYDLEASQKAGVPAIAFRCGGFWSDEHLRKRNPVEIYDGPMDLFLNFMHQSWRHRR